MTNKVKLVFADFICFGAPGQLLLTGCDRYDWVIAVILLAEGMNAK